MFVVKNAVKVPATVIRIQMQSIFYEATALCTLFFGAQGIAEVGGWRWIIETVFYLDTKKLFLCPSSIVLFRPNAVIMDIV